MEISFFNDIKLYIKTLVKINQESIILAGTNSYYEQEEYEMLISSLSDLFRLIPVFRDKKSGKLVINKKDGLIDYSFLFPEIVNDYEVIINKNEFFLHNAYMIRNKYQHKMHYAVHKGSMSGSDTLYVADFEIDQKKINISIESLIKVVKDLNILFNKFVNYIYLNGPKEFNHYINRLVRIDFLSFNQILNKKDDLIIIGQIFREV